MGQKVHPNGIRLGIIREWNAKWYAGKRGYAATLASDLKIREFITRRLANAALSRIVIDRPSQNLNITIFTARPGIVIGKKGEDIERLRHQLARMNGVPVQVAVEEIRKPELDAKLVAENICQQLEKRIMFRRAMKRAVQNSMRLGAEGVKVMLAGRLNGAEIARTEWYREGRVPLHTLRADIDYGVHEAHTTYGIIGVKVWIFKGEVYAPKKIESKPDAPAQATPEQNAPEQSAPEQSVPKQNAPKQSEPDKTEPEKAAAGHAASEAGAEAATKVALEAGAEVAPEAGAEAVPETTLEAEAEATPEAAPEAAPEKQNGVAGE